AVREARVAADRAHAALAEADRVRRSETLIVGLAAAELRRAGRGGRGGRRHRDRRAEEARRLDRDVVGPELVLHAPRGLGLQALHLVAEELVRRRARG